MLRWTTGLAVIGLLLGVGSVQGAIVTYFGEDESGTGSENSDDARDLFFSQLLSTPMTEGFDALQPVPEPSGSFGTTLGNVTLSFFNASGDANIAVLSKYPNGGRFAISPTRYVSSRIASGTGMKITFDDEFGEACPQRAIGFYGIDVGDFDDDEGNMAIWLTIPGQSLETKIVIDQQISISDRNGSIFYFGLIVTDPSEAFTAVRFSGHDTGKHCYWAMDDLTLATPCQVPEPAAMLVWTLLGLAWAGGGWRHAFWHRLRRREETRR